MRGKTNAVNGFETLRSRGGEGGVGKTGSASRAHPAVAAPGPPAPNFHAEVPNPCSCGFYRERRRGACR
jgi:hypothetical protein